MLCSGCAYIMALDASAASRQTRFRLIQFSLVVDCGNVDEAKS
jgi:hypothetical protein